MHFVTLPKKLVGLFMTAAVVLALTACGTGATGGAPATQPTASSAPTTAPTQTSADGALEPTSAGGSPAPTSTGGTAVSHDGQVRDQVSLIDALRKAGATIAIGDSIEQPFLSVTGTQLTLNGADVQLFQYADEAAAQSDATRLADTLAGKGTAMVTWVASPHAYRAGRVIALYVGDDTVVLKLLQEAMGKPFAEQNVPSLQEPTANPSAPTPAASHGAGQVTDLVSLVDTLRAQGLKVQPSGEVEQPFFDVTGSMLTVNSADVQVFEFADPSAAKDAMAKIGPDGNPATTIVEWVAPPHFYQAGRIVVLYIGQDTAIIKALTAALGEQVAGR